MRLELPIADSIRQHNAYSVNTNITPYVILWLIMWPLTSDYTCYVSCLVYV